MGFNSQDSAEGCSCSKPVTVAASRNQHGGLNV